MNNFANIILPTTVLYFPLINQRFIRKPDIFDLTNNRCNQTDIDKVLDAVEMECGYFERKKIILSRNRLSLMLFVTIFSTGLTITLICTGANTEVGFYIGMGIVTAAIFLLLVVIVVTHMLNHLEEHYFRVIQSNLERSNQSIERGGVHWNTQNLNLNYLELHVVEEEAAAAHFLAQVLKPREAITTEEDRLGTEPADRQRRRPFSIELSNPPPEKTVKNSDEHDEHDEEEKHGSSIDEDDDESSSNTSIES